MGNSKPLSHGLDIWTITPPTITFKTSPCVVDFLSPIGHRKALEQLAYYFRREMHFDFVQYEHTEYNRNYAGYLFSPDGRSFPELRTPVVGACLFRRNFWPDMPWTLVWVWIHPMERRRGLLSGEWKWLRERHGEFFVDTPLSPAMKAFMAKHDPALAEANGKWLEEQYRRQEAQDRLAGTGDTQTSEATT